MGGGCGSEWVEGVEGSGWRCAGEWVEGVEMWVDGKVGIV